MKEMNVSCARCPHHFSVRYCNVEEGKGLASCPTITRTELLAESMRLYKEPETGRFAQNASIQEGECYQTVDGVLRPMKPRLQETAEFAAKMGYRKLGLIFCEGLLDEAKVVDNYLVDKGFEVVSAVCKAGRTPKEDIGVLDEQKLVPGQHESMCNPIFQGLLVNEAEVDFNIIMGLCVGHDSLVISQLKAPVTILASKDRVLGHNPLAAVYQLESYFGWIK